VQISLPLLASLEPTQSAFFGLCVSAGEQVLEAMMEADRTARCGPAGMRDAARSAGCAGTTASRVVLGGREIALR
jgi:putative transposase